MSLKERLITLTIGILVGTVCTYAAVSALTTRAVIVFSNYENSQQERMAVKAFRELKPEADIFVQNALVDFIESRRKVGWIDEVESYRIVGFAKARIGVSLLKLSRKADSEVYITDAISNLQRAGIHVSNEKDLISAIENSGKKENSENPEEK